MRAQRFFRSSIEFPPPFGLEAIILEGRRESDYQDYQGMMDNVSITTNLNSLKERKNAACVPAGFPAGRRRRLAVIFSFLVVRKSSSPSSFQKSPKRRFGIFLCVIFESRYLFLGNLTLFHDFGLFCCEICEKATQKCGFFSCIFFINTGWYGRRDSNPRPTGS